MRRKRTSRKYLNPRALEFLEKLDKALEANPLPKKRSVFKLGITSSKPRRLQIEGHCAACTLSRKPLWEYPTRGSNLVRICSRCSSKFQERRGQLDALSRALPGSFGS